MTRPDTRESREAQPTHLCLDCGAVGYAGGYHDHGGGEAGDTASIRDVLAQLRRGGAAIDALQVLADRSNWSDDPETHGAILYGHFTPYELAVEALEGPA